MITAATSLIVDSKISLTQPSLEHSLPGAVEEGSEPGEYFERVQQGGRVNGFPPTLTAEPDRPFGSSRWTNYPSSHKNTDSR
jgi:hypothetical protein